MTQSILREQPTVYRTVILRSPRRNNVTRFRQLRQRRTTSRRPLARSLYPQGIAAILLLSVRASGIDQVNDADNLYCRRIVRQRWVPLFGFGAPSPHHPRANRRFPGTSQLKNKRAEVSADRRWLQNYGVSIPVPRQMSMIFSVVQWEDSFPRDKTVISYSP